MCVCVYVCACLCASVLVCERSLDVHKEVKSGLQLGAPVVSFEINADGGK